MRSRRNECNRMFSEASFALYEPIFLNQIKNYAFITAVPFSILLHYAMRFCKTECFNYHSFFHPRYNSSSFTYLPMLFHTFGWNYARKTFRNSSSKQESRKLMHKMITLGSFELSDLETVKVTFSRIIDCIALLRYHETHSRNTK